MTRGTPRRFLFDLARELGGMTVAELSSRITIGELEEWAAVARVEKDEREQDARIRRVEAQARSNRIRRR